MRKFLSLPLFIAVMLFVSCISENDIVTPAPSIDREETADVILRIRTPEGFFGNGTRTTLGFNDENRLNTITVLVFEYSTNQLISIRQGRNVDYTPELDPAPPGTPEISGTGTFEVTLFASVSPTDLFRIVVIANAANIVEAQLGASYSNVPDRSYNAVMTQLWSAISGKMIQGNNPAIPMFGETQNPVHIVESTTLSETIRLHRAVARIDVGVGTVSGHTSEAGFTWSGNNAAGQPIPFELASVYIMRPNNRFAVVPRNDAGQYGVLPTGTFGNPTIPTGTTAFTIAQSTNLFGFTAVNGNVHRQIYIPEANVRTPHGSTQTVTDIRSGDANHIERMAVVVGGYFNNSNTRTYYRVDFISNQADNRSLINVLRNHLYQINIMGVRAPGQSCPETAYHSLAMNMDVEINEWTMVTEETFFDGVNWIRLNHTRNESLSRHAILYRTANTEDRLYFETTISLDQWDLANYMSGQNDFYNSIVPNDPDFDTTLGTLIKTVQNDRFRIEFILTDDTRVGQGRQIFDGLIRFTSRIPFEANATDNPSTLRIEAGRMVGTSRIINFPIHITQRGDSPDDWYCGGYDDFELGEEEN